jgi:hypothetical protein
VLFRSGVYEKRLLLRCVSIVVARAKKESLFHVSKWLIQELSSLALKERFMAPLVTASSLSAIAVTAQSIVIVLCMQQRKSTSEGVTSDDVVMKTICEVDSKDLVMMEKEEEKEEKEQVVESSSRLILDIMEKLGGGGGGGVNDPRIQEASRACERLARVMTKVYPRDEEEK